MGRQKKLLSGGSSTVSPKALTPDGKISNDMYMFRWMAMVIMGIFFALAPPLLVYFSGDISERFPHLFGSQASALTDGTNESLPNQLLAQVGAETHTSGRDGTSFEPPCRFVMAESTFANGGFGIFSLVPIEPNEPVLFGEPVIQIVDLTTNRYKGISFLLDQYAWFTEISRGQHEGVSVTSVGPGVSMLANGHPDKFNVLTGLPNVSHDGLPRGTPEAGANTHYHSMLKYAYKNIQAGDEILIDYGRDWDDKLPIETNSNHKTSRSVDWLVRNGMCLDNMKSGLTKGRGHGAFASRHLSKGSVIAPVPVLVIDRKSLHMPVRPHYPVGPPRKQLLINYCYGHPQSSVLLFPYSPVISLVNQNEEQPNAVLRWSGRMKDPESWFGLDATQVKARHESGLLLELVAIRDIHPGDEILISYGDDYIQAWQAHLELYESLSPQDKGLEEGYVYAFEANQRVSQFRTLAEQETQPYEANLVTSCYYKYSQAVQHSTRMTDPDTGMTTTQAKWNLGQSMLRPQFLRPCKILDRQTGHDGLDLYTVEILNCPYPGSFTETMIPVDERHVVLDVPQKALLFTDRTSSTDQHLAYAFRHEMGLPQGVFPEKWLDLAETY